MKKLLLVLILLVFCFSIVSAETLTGTLGGSALSQSTWSTPQNSAGIAPVTTMLWSQTFQNTANTVSLVHFNQAGYLPTFSNTLSGNTTTFTATIGADVIATGTFGYQRYWSALGVEQPGYFYYLFNNYNTRGHTGAQHITITMANIDGMSFPVSSSNVYPPTGGMMNIISPGMYFCMPGSYLQNYDVDISADYSATKPSGLGISGTVIKTMGISKAYIFDGVTENILASDPLVTNNTLNFNVLSESIIIGVLSPQGIFYNSSVLFTSAVTPPPAADYYITVTPAWIPSDGSQYLYGQVRKTGTTSTNLTDLKTISWQWRKGETGQSYSYQETTNSKNWLQFTKGSGTIYSGWNTDTTSFSNTKTATLPNPLTLNPIGATGTILTTLYATDIYGNSYEFETSNLIGDNTTAATNNVKVRNQDAYTGGALLFSTISLRDDINNAWYNVTAQTGEYDFSIPANKQVTIYSTASGYQNLLKNATTPVNGVIHQNMYASGYVGDAGKTQLIVYTRSAPTSTISSQPLSEVYTTINQINQTLIKSDYSSEAGNVIFSANISTIYTITASKTGYTTVSQTIDTGLINPYEVYLYLTNKNVIPPTYTPTPYITPQPTLTNIGGQPINGTATTCQLDTDNLSPVNSLKNAIACFGFEGYLAQSLALAGLIIMLFVVVGGKAGKALGAALGGIIGFLLCVALGILPLWILIAFIVIGVGAIAIKALLSDG
jgi:hypothetical protein